MKVGLYINTYQICQLPQIDGFQFHTVKSSGEAIDFLHENYVDVVLITISVKDDKEIVNSEFQKMVTQIKEIDVLVPILLLTNNNTPNLEIFSFRLEIFGNIELPITKENLTQRLNRAILCSGLSTARQTITLETATDAQTYVVKDIYSIEIAGHRKIAIVTPNEEKGKGKVKSEEYSFRFSLGAFPKKYHVERFFKRASQSAFVNPLHIVKVKKDTKELVFTNGYRIPVSAKYIKDFL